MILELCQGIFYEHLGVIDMHKGAILHQHITDHQGRSLAHVTCVLFKGKAKNGDFLLGHSVEERLDDLAWNA